jgi:leucyl-tRNA synthetase
VSVAVQINGKTRDVIELPAGASESAAVEQARASEKVRRHLDGKHIARTIYVKDRLLNFVVR